MDTTQCINNNIWEAYAHKKLSQADMLYMEQHVKTCEICADIKEGIDALAMPESLSKRVQAVDTAVNEMLIHKTQVKKHNWYWAAAAAIFIVVGALLFINYMPTNEQLAVKDEKQKVASDAPKLEKTDDMNKVIQKEYKQENKEPIADNHKPQSIKSSANTNTFATPPAEKEILAANDAALESEPAITEEISRAETTTKSLALNMARERKTATDSLESSNLANKLASSTSKQKSSMLPAPYNNNQNKETTLSNADYAGVLSAKSNTQEEQILYNAQQAFNKQLYDSCMHYLAPILPNKRAAVYEEAQLLAAKTEIEQQNKPAARVRLKALMKLKGKKEKDAAALLKTISP